MTQNLRLEWRTAEELADNPANWRMAGMGLEPKLEGKP